MHATPSNTQRFIEHLRRVLEQRFNERLKTKLLLRSGLEITGYVRVMSGWVEVLKEPAGAHDSDPQPRPFAHVGLDDLAAFEEIEHEHEHVL